MSGLFVVCAYVPLIAQTRGAGEATLTKSRRIAIERRTRSCAGSF